MFLIAAFISKIRHIAPLFDLLNDGYQHICWQTILSRLLLNYLWPHCTYLQHLFSHLGKIVMATILRFMTWNMDKMDSFENKFCCYCQYCTQMQSVKIVSKMDFPIPLSDNWLECLFVSHEPLLVDKVTFCLVNKLWLCMVFLSIHYVYKTNEQCNNYVICFLQHDIHNDDMYGKYLLYPNASQNFTVWMF